MIDLYTYVPELFVQALGTSSSAFACPIFVIKIILNTLQEANGKFPSCRLHRNNTVCCNIQLKLNDLCHLVFNIIDLKLVQVFISMTGYLTINYSQPSSIHYKRSILFYSRLYDSDFNFYIVTYFYS